MRRGDLRTHNVKPILQRTQCQDFSSWAVRSVHMSKLKSTKGWKEAAANWKCNKVLQTKKCSFVSHHRNVSCILTLTICLIRTHLIRFAFYLLVVPFIVFICPAIYLSLYFISLSCFVRRKRQTTLLSCSLEAELIPNWLLGILLLFCRTIPI